MGWAVGTGGNPRGPSSDVGGLCGQLQAPSALGSPQVGVRAIRQEAGLCLLRSFWKRPFLMQTNDEEPDCRRRN